MTSTPARLDIIASDADPVIAFAASELWRCLRLMASTPTAIEVRGAPRSGVPALVLRRFDAAEARRLPVDDLRLDDAVAIDVRDGAGTIAGANPRSVLIAVYRFLRELGARFVRPGPDGEYLPRIDVARAAAKVEERPAYRHRGVCIEGAVSAEHALGMVDWLPKVGLSGWFMQFTDGFAFYERWYRHDRMPVEAEPFPRSAARAITARVEAEAARRGLVHHAVGHGWTCMALGLDLSDWNPQPVPGIEALRPLIAEVGGKRALQWDRPMITSLCFANPEARRRLVDAAVAHAVANPGIDLLHLWIDDGMHNKCECALCAVKSPSDWYALMLQELHVALGAAGCAMKVVFLGYSDLLWAPSATAPAIDPGRHVFMYANSRGDYLRPMKPLPADRATVPPYVRNKSRLVRDQAEFQGFLAGWQQRFAGDSFIYEYHLCSGLQALEQYWVALAVHEDVRQLRTLGLGGLVMCQTLRAFAPVPLVMHAMAAALWDPRGDGEAVLDDLCLAALGPDSAQAKEFLKVSSEDLRRAMRFGEQLEATAQAGPALAALRARLVAFAKIVERNVGDPDACRARSWWHLRFHVRLLERLERVLARVAGIAPGPAAEGWEALKAWLAGEERAVADIFDANLFAQAFDRWLNEGRYSRAPEDVAPQVQAT